jgi:uncharacterized protein (TIGR03000 family)
MFKHILGAALALLIFSGDIYAQRGGHGGGGGGGGYRGGYGGGFRGGYGGYGRGFYGGYGGWGWGYPYYGYGYGIGAYGYPYEYGGYSYPYYSGYYDLGTSPAPDTPVVPNSPNYIPPINSTDPHSPTIIELGGGSSGSSGAAYRAATATVSVIVPQGGQVWFNDNLNPLKAGSKWVFTTDKLDVGKTYVLNVKARWKEDGQDKSYSIPVRMEAGDNMTVDLTKIR